LATRLLLNFHTTKSFTEAQILLADVGSPSNPLTSEQLTFREELRKVGEQKDASTQLSLLVALMENVEKSDNKALYSRPTLETIRGRSSELPNYECFRQKSIAHLSNGMLKAGVPTPSKEELSTKRIVHYSKALECYESQEGFPTPLDVLNNLAWFLVDSEDEGQHARGLELAERAIELAPDVEKLPGIYDTHAWALHRNGRHQEASDSYYSLLDAVDAPKYRYRLAQVLFALKKYDDALEVVRKVLNAPGFESRDDALKLRSEIRETMRRELGPAATELPSGLPNQ